MPKLTKRRDLLKSATAASVVGLSGLAGCTSDIGLGGVESIPLGSILPLTGVLEDFGNAMETGVEIAVDEINEQGGPLGRELELYRRDSETRPEAGLDRYEELVANNDIVGFVGAASSGVSAPIAEAVAEDQVMMISPASTSPIFADLGWRGDVKYVARTAPNDGQQGVIIAWVLEEVLEAESASYLFVDNPYGEGLADVAREHFDGESLAFVGYDPESSDFTATLDTVFEDDPDAVGFVGYPGEAEAIFTQWDEGGYGGDWVSGEGIRSDAFLSDMADILEGMYLTTPNPEDTPGRQHFVDLFPGDLQGVFEEHSYDAVYLHALAMHRAGEASGPAIAGNIMDVATQGGTEVFPGEFDRAVELLDDGETIQYIGASSPVAFNENREPLSPYAATRITAEGELETIETFPIAFFEDLGF